VGANPFSCASCNLHYFFNPAVSAGAFIFDKNQKALFVQRSHEPAKDKLGLPGGFVNMDETIEDALRREIREEVNLEVGELNYLGSWPNHYLYREITYIVADLYFYTHAIDIEKIAALDGVARCLWKDLLDINENELAFPPLKKALEKCRTIQFK
jgi:ADP-ribose pyrophosphatase YjhB (NUDIX family)